MTTQTQETLDTQENISIMFGETHHEACFDDFKVTDEEYQAVLSQLEVNEVEYYEDVLDTVANNFRIDTSNMSVISEGYYLPAVDVWYADANHVLMMLERSNIAVSGIEDATSNGHAVYQSPFPDNPRFAGW